ncbi:hypothetical protein PYW08_009573 [Mythimna loreyi]|uniref:Uncharacterized protein n=1 Tax=Mythimna loreyi TaxID=667449 RepID=A0ACC2Q6E0_9NEOP|nr:hypothetical protein PYW08_009573 [Mythimna loreyi]
MSSSSAKELEVITNQPSPRSSSIQTNPLDLTPDLLKENTNTQTEDTSLKDPLIFDDRPPKDQPVNSSDENTILIDKAGSIKQLNEAPETPNENNNQPNEAATQNGATNSTKDDHQTISKNPESSKNDRSLNGPVNSDTENLGLGLCLMQFCNLCSACVVDCCNQYYNWCCCCFMDSDICVEGCTGFVECCTGCTECCTECDCSCCN